MDAGWPRGHRRLAGQGGGTDLSRRDAELVAKGPGEARCVGEASASAILAMG